MSVSLEIVPHKGVGPVQFEMSPSEVQEAINNSFGSVDHHRSEEGVDYFFKSALEIDYEENKALFIGTQYHTNCGCDFSINGVDPFNISSNELFEFLSKLDKSGKHEYSPSEYIFPNLQVTLWDADEQYDYKGKSSRKVYGQVGVAHKSYYE